MDRTAPSSAQHRPGSVVESHRGRDPRLSIFYTGIAILLLTLTVGLAREQLFNTERHRERETFQNQRRVVVPGPRGNIYDRDGRLLVGNQPRFSVTLNLDELANPFRREYLRIRTNYRESGDQDLPTDAQLARIARVSVVQAHLDVVNRILGERRQVDGDALERHYRQARILPYPLVEDVPAAAFARLIEQLPVNSPLQLTTSSKRRYPHGSLAAHTLGYTASDADLDPGDALPGEGLTTFRMRGSIGRAGLEAALDARLQGIAGGAVYRVNPAGYRVHPPIEWRRPVQGGDVTITLDLDLQKAAEAQLAEIGMAGAAVALDVATGEVLVLASKPDYDLNAFSPRLSREEHRRIEESGAWENRATRGLYPPGSSFKLITAIAAMRAGRLDPDSTAECTGAYRVGGAIFVCNNHRDRGPVGLPAALEKSCNVFFYEYGLRAGIEAIATEARRHALDRPTGIELPGETTRMIVPDPAWLERFRGERWFPGHTANVAIGQGDLVVTPLQMACLAASLARGETTTRPTLLHNPAAPRQRSETDGLSPEQRSALLAGMVAATRTGTARVLQTPRFRVPGLEIAGKTGTAQKRTPRGTINFAWFVGFAPVDAPQIATAVLIEGDTPGDEVGGGRYATPVAGAIFKAWAEKNAGRAPAEPAR